MANFVEHLFIRLLAIHILLIAFLKIQHCFENSASPMDSMHFHYNILLCEYAMTFIHSVNGLLGCLLFVLLCIWK
jgi:hypothetical protein